MFHFRNVYSRKVENMIQIIQILVPTIRIFFKRILCIYTYLACLDRVLGAEGWTVERTSKQSSPSSNREYPSQSAILNIESRLQQQSRFVFIQNSLNYWYSFREDTHKISVFFDPLRGGGEGVKPPEPLSKKNFFHQKKKG